MVSNILGCKGSADHYLLIPKDHIQVGTVSQTLSFHLAIARDTATTYLFTLTHRKPVLHPVGQRAKN